MDNQTTYYEVEGYVYCPYRAKYVYDTDDLYSAILEYFPDTTYWIEEENFPDADKRDYYDVLIQFDGVLPESELAELKKLLFDYRPRSSYSINYRVMEDDGDDEENILPPLKDFQGIFKTSLAGISAAFNPQS